MFRFAELGFDRPPTELRRLLVLGLLVDLRMVCIASICSFFF
jgi:hypothetical protein